MSHAVYPECPICGKTSFPGVHAARLASRGAGNRLHIYALHGAFHISDQEKDKPMKLTRRRQERL